MRWENDLVKDIRLHNKCDDMDYGIKEIKFRQMFPPRPHKFRGPGGQAFSPANQRVLLEQFLLVRDRCKFIMEIGVDRDGYEHSSTKVLLENKLPETIYLGIDIKPKNRLDDHKNNIHTICCPSQDYETIRAKIQELGVVELDFFMIDGLHSINQVLAEWEYTDILSEHGTVAFHDTRYHPGPNLFVNNLDQTKWDVIPDAINVTHDFGIGFAKRKHTGDSHGRS
ncbi:MAG: hypothetical protein ACQ9ET_00570 [Nitrosomonadaceae bacterium]